DVRPALPPARPQTDLYDVVPTDPKIGYDVRKVIEIIADGGEFDEFKELFGTTLVTAFARIHGHPVGIIGNNGVLFAEAAQKG
ncbi:carboxyl transferase domain-containing protein, partial [Mycobacterium kansasii]